MDELTSCALEVDRSATKTKHSRWRTANRANSVDFKKTRQISLNISCWKMVNFPLWVQQIMNSIICNVIYSRWLSYSLPPHRPVILVMNYEAESASYGAFPVVKVL
jgi:hypothetical protein